MRTSTFHSTTCNIVCLSEGNFFLDASGWGKRGKGKRFIRTGHVAHFQSLTSFLPKRKRKQQSSLVCRRLQHSLGFLRGSPPACGKDQLVKSNHTIPSSVRHCFSLNAPSRTFGVVSECYLRPRVSQNSYPHGSALMNYRKRKLPGVDRVLLLSPFPPSFSSSESSDCFPLEWRT
ncbi:hypothetical protein VTO42DRAFT_276 [Malbranchea cinnamomea]